MTKSVVLVQGPQSAFFWKDRVKTVSADQWLCYDARSASVLGESGVAISRDGDYLHKAPAKCERLEKKAYELASNWFQDAPPLYKDLKPEMLYISEFDYYFLALFRAYALLDVLNEKETPAKLFTTTYTCDPEQYYGVRLGMEESSVPSLLKSLGGRWAFETESFDLNGMVRPISKESKHTLHDQCRQGLGGLLSRTKRAPVLFSGNPGLLTPVRKALSERKTRSLRVKYVNSYKGFLASFRGGQLPFTVPGYSSKPLPFEEKAFFEAFEGRKTFEVDGVDFLPVVWDRIRNFYRWEAPRIKRFFDEAVKNLKAIQPQCVVVDEDVLPLNRALVCAAKSLDIPTWVIMHGLPVNPEGFVPMAADHIAVWGAYERDVLQKWGVSPEKITITGCPKYDAMCADPQDRRASREKICKNFGWSPEKPLVLAVPGGARPNGFEYIEKRASTGFEIMRTAEYFLRIAREVPNVNFIYKFRLEKGEAAIYECLLRQIGGLSENIRWVQDGLAVEYVGCCDLVANSISSAGLEAVLARVPVVNLNFSPFNYEQDVPFTKDGITPIVRSYEGARQLFLDLGEGRVPLAEWVEKQEKIVEPYLHSRDGHSSQRVADEILRSFQN